jgi:hypothetical protein
MDRSVSAQVTNGLDVAVGTVRTGQAAGSLMARGATIAGNVMGPAR